jgi:mannose-6-phosphate isomerase-like protein (cupin superfamily)
MSIDLGGFRMSVKATSEDTAGSFSLLEADEPIDFGPHRDAAKAFYVLEGEYRIFIEGREFRCPSGAFIFVPAAVRMASGLVLWRVES